MGYYLTNLDFYIEKKYYCRKSIYRRVYSNIDSMSYCAKEVYSFISLFIRRVLQ